MLIERKQMSEHNVSVLGMLAGSRVVLFVG